MDWKNLKEKATTWTAQATKIAKKWFETSKEYAEKTGDFTYAKIKESKFVIKNTGEYEELQKEKRYAIFCIRDGESFTKFFLATLPVLFTKAWIESGSIRVIIEEGTEDLRKAMQIEATPGALVKMNDGTIQNLNNEEEVRAFIKDFSFYS